MAAAVADQKGNRLGGAVGMAAREKGVAGGEPMHEPLLHQKIQRAVDLRRGGPAPGGTVREQVFLRRLSNTVSNPRT